MIYNTAELPELDKMEGLLLDTAFSLSLPRILDNVEILFAASQQSQLLFNSPRCNKINQSTA